MNKEYKLNNMKIYTDKTETISIRRDAHNLNVTVDNQNLKQVNVFKFLDTTFYEDGIFECSFLK